jgi:16S rRNA (guanine966-N2)-methyltransferase
VRQAIFNSLDSAGLIEDAVVVDLYAGSGALGIEALSRGAARCTFVEKDRAALAALRENIAALGLIEQAKVVASDALTYCASMPDVDIALIDPPYRFEQWPEVLGTVRAEVVVAESDRETEPAEGWEQVRSKHYGRTWVTMLRRVAG